MYYTDEEKLKSKQKKLINGFRKYNDREQLAEAIRNNPKILTTKIMTDFLADIVLEKEKPIVKGRKNKEVEARNKEICSLIAFLSGTGIPIKNSPDIDEQNCCKLIAEQYSLHEDTIYKEIWRKRDKDSFSKHVIYTSKSHGEMIRYFNKNITPKTLEEIGLLEKKLREMSESEFDIFYAKYVLERPLKK